MSPLLACAAKQWQCRLALPSRLRFNTPEFHVRRVGSITGLVASFLTVNAFAKGIVTMNPTLSIPRRRVAEFCRENGIVRLAIFGSALREDFGPESDIDVLVSFKEDVHHTLFDMSRMEAELKEILGREVDLVSQRGIESSSNHLRRKAILESAEPVYGS